jgi:FtsH-binding integral membrane protein
LTEPTPAPQPQPRGHGRRPPLAEIDSWELWQAWRRGERARVLPWIGLLAGFCIVLAAMYAYFFVSSVLSRDTVFPIVLLVVYLGFLYWVWRRISPRRDFALGVVLVMVAVSAVAFGLWFLAYALSGYSIWVGIIGTAGLGVLGLLVALPALNTMARRS